MPAPRSSAMFVELSVDETADQGSSLLYVHPSSLPLLPLDTSLVFVFVLSIAHCFYLFRTRGTSPLCVA